MGSIRGFFENRVILLTGGTGFLGKALQEKILRDLDGIGRLYVLVRPKERPDGSSLSPQERLRREIFETAIFARLRQAHGERYGAFLAGKVVPVAGDLSLPDLGLAAEDRERLRDEVDVVIHAAASVFFDERIDHAVEMNTRGPERLMALARSFRKPAVFSFVSTAYVAGRRPGLVPEEPPRPGWSAARLAGEGGAPPFDVTRELDEIDAATRAVMARAAGPELAARFRAEEQERPQREGASQGLEALADACRERWVERELVREGMRRARRHGWHEVYTYTKAMGEAKVVKGRGDLPVAILRPSIIESSLAEPEPGWINGLKVADPLIAGYAKGRVPDFPGRPAAVLDIIPVDMVANAILAATTRLGEEPGLHVYHVATGARNPCTVKQVFEQVRAYYKRHPMRDKQGEPIRVGNWRFPSTSRFRARYRYGMQLPLQGARGVVRATGFLPWPDGLAERLEGHIEGLERLLYYTDIYAPYTSLDCVFDDSQTRRLLEGLAPEDRKRFPFDVAAISWPIYLQDIHLSGLDRHVLRFGRAPGTASRQAGRAEQVRVSTESLQTLPDLLELSADRFGDKVALQVKRNGSWSRLTYRELRRQAGLLGAQWRREGLARGDRVLLLSENQPEWAVAYFAAQAVGATVVPLDVHTPPHEIAELASFTEARAVLCTAAVYPSLPKSLHSSPIPIWNLNNRGLAFEDRGVPSAAPPDPSQVRWEELGPDDVASIIFTSGPAVEPRGAMLTHRNFLSNLLSLSEALRSYETDRFVSVLPLHHALEFTGGLLMPLFSGATVSYAQTLKSSVILDLMAQTGATALLAVPRIFEMLLARLQRGAERPGGEAERLKEVASFVNRVRLLVSGGAPLDHSIYEAFAELGTPIHEGYGLTETSPILTVNPMWAIRPRSVGKALPGVELRLERMDGTGEGEIVVRGSNVMKGYFKNPAETARILKDGWLYTGDLGRLDGDGYLTITGRCKELIVTGAGKNVWPQELELFYRGIPGVDELAVFGVRPPGATRETVHAAVFTKADQGPILEAIHAVSHERPTYQRVQHVHFWHDELPRGADGRGFDRIGLRDAVIRKLRDTKQAKREAAVGGAGVAWWERDTLLLLGRIAARPDEEPITRKDALFQLFDSLQSVELLAALEARLGISISEEEAAQLRSVGDLLERIRREVGDREEPPALEVAPETSYWTAALSEAGAPPLKPVSPFAAPLRALLLAGSGLALKTLCRLSVRGLERLPRDGCFLLAANHASHLDSLCLLATVGARLRDVHILGARDYFFDTPAKSWLFRHLLHVVPFDRERNFAEGLQVCRQVLRPGEPVLIFPEGTRSPHGRLQPFKVGLGILALELDAAVVPVHIRGTHEALPKGARFPRPNRIDVAVGEAIPIEPYRQRLESTSRYELYREIVTEVRQRIEQLSEEG